MHECKESANVSCMSTSDAKVEVHSYNGDPNTGKYEARINGKVVSGPHTSMRAARLAGEKVAQP